MRAREILNELRMPLGKPVHVSDLTFGFEVEMFMTQRFAVMNGDEGPEMMIADINDFADLENYFDVSERSTEDAVSVWGEENDIDDPTAEAMFDEVGAVKFVEETGIEPEWGYFIDDGGIYAQPSFFDAAQALQSYLEDQLGLYEIELPRHIDEKTTDKDYRNWYLEPDISLRVNDESDYGIELTSPILSFDEFRENLSAILELIQGNDGLYTNGSSGLHVNIGFRNGPPALDRVKLLAFAGEKWLGSLFRRSDANEQIQPLLAKITDEASFDANFDTLVARLNEMLDGVDDKSFAINLLPLDDKGYIEFRALGGKDYETRKAEVFRHVDRFIRLIEVASNPATGRQDYRKKLYTALMGGPAKADGDTTEIRAIKAWLRPFGQRNVDAAFEDGKLTWTPQNLFIALMRAIGKNATTPPMIIRALVRLTGMSVADLDEIAASKRRFVYSPDDEDEFDAVMAALRAVLR